jgi:hypothetical protein
MAGLSPAGLQPCRPLPATKGLRKGKNYEVRLRHATSAGHLRTKNLNMVVLPFFAGKEILLDSGMIITLIDRKQTGERNMKI